MCHIIFSGTALPNPDILTPLYRRGYMLTFAPGDQFCALTPAEQPRLIVVTLTDRLALLPFQPAHPQALPWLAWNQADDPALSVAAYEAGARAVLPAAISPDGLLRSVQHALSQTDHAVPRVPPATARIKRYRRGEAIPIDPTCVSLVERGQVVQTALHPDGSEVVLSFFGPGALITALHQEYVAVHNHAHTEVHLVSRPWVAVAGDPQIGATLRKQLYEQQAWAAAQAHPQIRRRILGMLSLLADRFGRSDPAGIVIDLRLTHAHLAAAVGATRSTVTRTLGELRAAGHIAVVGSGAGERIRLPHRSYALGAARE